MKKQEPYWSYRAPPTPELSDLPEGSFAGTERGFNSLSPGFRREIYRSSMKRVEETKGQDERRFFRADEKHKLGETQIKAREAL